MQSVPIASHASIDMEKFSVDVEKCSVSNFMVLSVVIEHVCVKRIFNLPRLMYRVHTKIRLR